MESLAPFILLLFALYDTNCSSFPSILILDRGNIGTAELVPYRPLIYGQVLREMNTLVSQAQARGWMLDSAKNIVRFQVSDTWGCGNMEEREQKGED